MKKITRRQFLTSAGATSAALLLSSLPHAAAADENCLRKVTPAATNSNDLSWDMAEEILTHISDPVFPAYTVNVLDYGAVPNDGKLDTAAIQRAIDETSAHGGGTVVIPSGVYDVGAITLKSNVNLHLESKDTILRFTRDITPANYPLVFAHYEGSKLYNWSPLIYAYQQENIALTGKGTLDGQADKNNWWNWSRTVNPDGTTTRPSSADAKLLRKMTDDGTPAEERIFGEGHYLRPNFYQPMECTNVLTDRDLIGKIDGILLDLGVSSPQLDDAERGFSFMRDGPLDMRMDPTRGQSAAEWLQTAEEADIAWVLKTYGEERFAKRIARAIVERNREQPMTRTKELAEVVAAATPVKDKFKHPATRTFQAVRIWVNSELEEIEQALKSSLNVLAPGGRLSIISFHSLEDRIVKRFMRENSRGPQVPAGLPMTEEQLKKLGGRQLRALGKLMPGEEEVAENPRARSSVLRIAERTNA